MGGAVGIAPILLVLLLVTVVVVAFLMRGANRNREVYEESARDPDGETLRYRVPDGQDPAAVAAALQQHGFDATTESAPGHHDVLVACPPGSGGRESARRVIAEHAPLNLESDPAPGRGVRFVDED